MSCKPDLPTTLRMYAHYLEGRTCTQIAATFGISRQSVWDRFRAQRMKLRPCPRNLALPFIDWGGTRWAPDKDGYFRRTQRSSGHRRREVLHRAMWEQAHGRIKRSWVVRFVDGDRMNVDLDNLEAVPRTEMHSVKPIALKPCLACGELMVRRATGNHPEGPSAYAKRKTCNAQCSGNWKRGRKRGARMPTSEGR